LHLQIMVVITRVLGQTCVVGNRPNLEITGWENWQWRKVWAKR
jgi:hypothetical protein